MKSIAFIPARYGSTRFPGKPLARIQGKPMIQRVYECAMACPDVSDVVVATDDERIRECVQGFGGRAVMTSGDHPSGTDRIAEAAEKLEMDQADVIVNVQGDQPHFHPSALSRLVAPLRADREIPMSTLKYAVRDPSDMENPNHVKVVTDKEGYALYFSRASIPFFRDQEVPDLCYKHLGFYAYRADFLKTFVQLPVGRLEQAEKLEQLRALEFGYRIMVVETETDSLEVDTPEDVKRVEDLLKRTAAS